MVCDNELSPLQLDAFKLVYFKDRLFKVCIFSKVSHLKTNLEESWISSKGES